MPRAALSFCQNSAEGRSLPWTSIGAPIQRRDGRPFGNALLTTLPVLGTRRICLDYHQREPRTALEVRVWFPEKPIEIEEIRVY